MTLRSTIQPGQTIGKLTVLNLVERKPGYKNYWKCICECGQEVIREGRSLLRGFTKSCGCLRSGPRNPEKHIGKKFYMLLVQDFYSIKENNQIKYYYKCVCDCGMIVDIPQKSISSQKSCGCYRYKWNSKSYKGISGTYWASVTKGAEYRNLDFNITKEDVWQLYLKQDQKCALSGQLIYFADRTKLTEQTVSIDRIDSSRGYDLDNIQLVHKEINILKRNFSDERLIELSGLITDYQRSKKNGSSGFSSSDFN